MRGMTEAANMHRARPGIVTCIVLLFEVAATPFCLQLLGAIFVSLCDSQSFSGAHDQRISFFLMA